MLSLFKMDQTRSVLTMQLLLSTLLISFLTGCGFHLRGLDSMGQMQFTTVQLQNVSGVSIEIQKALRRQLRSAGVKLVDSMDQAEVQISFKPTEFKTSRTAYSGQGDTTAELLKMSQFFSANLMATDQLIIADSVSTYRDRQIETTALLASNNELQSIKQEMANILARQLVDRINRALLKQTSEVSQHQDSAVNSTPLSTGTGQ